MEAPLGLQAILLIAAAIAIVGSVIAVVLLWLASRGTGFRPVLRGGVRVVGSDTGAGHSVLLTDPILGLLGRPDLLLEEKNGRQCVLVPVEVKPTRRSSHLYESDAMQLGAYLVASRATFGLQAADFGYVRYAEQVFRVRLTEQLERRVTEIVAGIRHGEHSRTWGGATASARDVLAAQCALTATTR